MGGLRVLWHSLYRNGIWLALSLVAAVPAAAQDPGFSPSTAGITVPTKLWAALGDPTTQTGKEWFVPDAAGGASLIISDGIRWRVFARDVSLQAHVLTSGDAGVFTFSYSFSATPNVQISVVDNTTTGGLTYNLQNQTATGVTVRVNRNLLTSLFGGSTVGCTINLFAAPNN